ncbi:MAG: hypothetical protein M1814_003402 [Vezdaea aestivalis]|nr:MAG: hypothetical protein M1814_003402 [Vezdaea aestivalis]
MPALDVDLDEARATFETNVFAPMRLTRSLAPLLIAAHGTIINIGSVAAIVPYTFGSVYNASKGALHAWSNTLRVEMIPFNVKVILVVTGGVQSRIARVTRSLPPDSLYLPIDADYQRRQTHSQEDAMPHAEYAKSVVNHVMKGATGIHRWYWEGNKAVMIWFVWRFLPNGYFDSTMGRMFGLDRLARIVAGQNKSG